VTAASSSYKGHRYPPEIIAHCVWLYHRFPLGTVKLIGGLIVRVVRRFWWKALSQFTFRRRSW